MEIKYRNVIALVKDVQVSKCFYRDVIGLTVEQEFDTFVLFRDGFAIHTADLFYEYIDKPYHNEKMGHDNVDFYFTTPQLEEFRNKLKEHGVSFIHEIRLHAWGENVLRVYDPDGHILEIGDAHGDNGLEGAEAKELLSGFIHMKQSTIKIVADKTIYFDPYEVSGAPKDADIIFVTHTHGDHLSIADIRKVANHATKIVVPQDGAAVLVKEGFTHLLTVIPDESYSINGLDFETVPSYNTNKDFHTKARNWVGYILTLNGSRYYIAGDTDVIPEMSTFKADVAFLPVGGTYTMTAQEAARAANMMKPSIAVPIHYADVVGTEEDAHTFICLLEPTIKGVILKE